MSCNFIDWYQIKENAKILIVEKETKELEQYKNQKYDYIYLNGVLENAKVLIKSENPNVELIRFFKELLTEDGTLFIAVDNKWGVKYLAGNKSEHCNNIYDSLKNNFSEGKLFSKNELDEIIKETGFKNKRYYYPLPNYEQPNVIFTDEFLPDKSNSKLNYNVIYDENSLILQDEIILLKIFIEEKKFEKFTNSYIIELSDKEINKKVKYYSFNNMRKEKYSLILKMQDYYVEKHPKTKKALQHVLKINENSKRLKQLGFNIAEEEEKNIIKSKFINLELLDKQIIQEIDNKKIEKVYELIDKWYKYISDKLETNNKGITKDGFIDLVFENTFYDKEKDEFIFFDQEWFVDNISIKFILFRAIRNLYEHNPRLSSKISQEKIFEKYELKDYLEEFEKKEKEFQEEVIDKEKQNFYAKQYKYKISSEEVKKMIKDVIKLDRDNIELTNEIKRLESKIAQKDEIIENQKKEIKNLDKTTLEKIKNKIFKK